MCSFLILYLFLLIVGAVETVGNWLIISVNWLILAVGDSGGNVFTSWGINEGFTPRVVAIAGFIYRVVYDFTRFTTPCAHKLYTFFTQLCGRVLRIQTLPNCIHLLADHVVELNFFLNFFNRVNGCRVIFATKLAGNLREA